MLRRKKAEPKLRGVVGKCKALIRKMPHHIRISICDNMEAMFLPT